MISRPRVLLVDTLSATNDFGVEMPVALSAFADLTVFTLRGTKLVSRPHMRVIVGFPEFGGSRSKLHKLLTQVVATARLASLLWAFRKDVIHVQAFRSIVMELPLYTLLRPLLATLVCTVHNALPHERSWWQPLAYGHWYRLLHKAHVLSTHTGDALVKHFGLSPDKLVYAPHGNYASFLESYPPAEVAQSRAKLGLPAHQVLVFFFGLIRDYKGVDMLIAASGQMRSTNVTILVAGGCEPDMQMQIDAALAQRKGGPVVDLRYGFLPQQTLSDWLAAADLVVFPYRHIYQSGAVMLAMTYGKAMLASDVAGFREYLDDGHTGALCDAQDPVQFAARLDELVADAPQRELLGRNAGHAARTRYAWSNIALTISGGYGP